MQAYSGSELVSYPNLFNAVGLYIMRYDSSLQKLITGLKFTTRDIKEVNVQD